MVNTQPTAPEQPPPFGGTAGAVANESNTPVEDEDEEGLSTATADSIDYPWSFAVKRPWILRKSVPQRFTESEKAQAWSRTTDIVKTYSDDLIKRLNAEIDALLVYAGLFSAVVTAFNVESYVLLQPQTPDPSLVVLQRISAQLVSSSVHFPSPNQTEPPSPLLSAPPSLAPAWTVWLNMFWFSSLIFSLAAASIGITVKQWLQEYSSGLSGTARHTARLRQRRLNSLAKWRVADITAALPVMLQLALGLYSVGLLILLWNLHPVVAALASTLVALLFMFTLATSVLPLFHDDCSYLSTQSLALYALWIKLYPPGRQLLYKAIRSCAMAACWLCASVPWRIRRRLRRLPRLPAWSMWIARLQDTPKLPPIAYQTWRGREHTTVNALNSRLDADMLAQAFDVCLDEEYLDVAAIGITDLARLRNVLYCCERLTNSLAQHVKPIDPGSEGISPLILRHRFWSSLVVYLCLDDRGQITMDHLEWLSPSGAVVFRQKDIEYGLLHSFVGPCGSMVQWDYDPRDVEWLSRVLPALAKYGDYEQSPFTMIWASYAVCTWKEPVALADSKLAASTRRQIFSVAYDVIARMSSDINFSWPNIDDDTVLFCTHVSAVALIWDLVGRSRETALGDGPHRHCQEANQKRLWSFAQYALTALTERLKFARATQGGTCADGYYPLLHLVAALGRLSCSQLLTADGIEAFLRLPCISEAPGPHPYHRSQTIVYQVRAIQRRLREAQCGEEMAEMAPKEYAVVPDAGGSSQGCTSSISNANETSSSDTSVTSATLTTHHSSDLDMCLGHQLGCQVDMGSYEWAKIMKELRTIQALRTNPAMRASDFRPAITWLSH